FVLGIVFTAVLSGALVFIPLFFQGKGEKVQNEGKLELFDDPVKRFIDPDELQKMRYTACVIVGGLGLAIVIVFNGYWWLIGVFVLAFVAYFLPLWIIKRKIVRRSEQFDKEILDLTILIANTLRAGIALPTAIDMAIHNVGGVVNEEFSAVLREHRLGVDLAESIERLNKRMGSENMQLFSTTICVTMRTGGSMADILEHVIITIRQRLAFQDKLKNMTAQLHFEALAISLSPVAAFGVLYLLDRDLMKPMLTTGIGWLAIFAVAALELVGFYVMRHVTKVNF
ncbi:MAG: type II secretion system F family protein, partial [Victivallaceae bacterium]